MLEERQNRLGIKVVFEPDKEDSDAMYYHLIVASEANERKNPMFFTSPKIHQRLTGQTIPEGQQTGYFRLIQEKTPAIHIQETYPFGNPGIRSQKFLAELQGTGISSQAEVRILADLIQRGFGEHGVVHAVAMLDQRVNQLAKRLGIRQDLDSYKKRIEIHRRMSKLTVKEYHRILSEYINKHETD